jgi:hypothetical protein
MTEKINHLKWSGSIALLGNILFAVSTAFHPMIIDPWAGLTAMEAIADSPAHWEWDHALMAVAVILWLAGLAAGGESYVDKLHVGTRSASRLFIAALAMWLIILAFELTTLPEIALTLAANASPVLSAMAIGLFAFGLVAGYLAMILVWLGVTLLAWRMRQLRHFSRWLGNAGVYGGLIGIAGIGVTMLQPEGTFWLLAATSLAPFLWTTVLAWKIIQSSTH